MISIHHAVQLVRNMGFRYIVYRSYHELARRSGLLKFQFPTNTQIQKFIDFKDWRTNAPIFFFARKADLNFEKVPSKILSDNALAIISGQYPFFNSTNINLGQHHDWLTNPSNGFKYSSNVHWTDIPDFSEKSGDIKYVWEQSRFSWLYALIRDDYHNQNNHGEFIFSSIESWIDQNPINLGPNWRCSQEISLRVLNWTFALYYYRDHASLTEARFDRIIHAIYWQTRHVYSNIHFSRIAVRNNHAITETLMLYLAGLLFPFFPESVKWKEKGKRWFEQEIGYQIYEDGAYLQHSFNYQRVVVQLLSWALVLSRKHGDTFNDTVFARARQTLTFLQDFQFGRNGALPNYGNNDGALFFPLSSVDFSDFRPQLQALDAALYGVLPEPKQPESEETQWYLNGHFSGRDAVSNEKTNGTFSYAAGGYYGLRTEQTSLMIRCCSFRDRPAQADNLHLDLWLEGENVLRDSGTYRYNTSPELAAQFSSAAAHNTVTLGDYDQMQKGGRFIWYHWSRAVSSVWTETPDYWEFSGTIIAFGHLGKGISHSRRVRQYKQILRWEISDQIEHQTGLPMHQVWRPAPAFSGRLVFESVDAKGNPLTPQWESGWYSAYYGVKEPSPKLVFSTATQSITTTIEIKE